MRRFVLVAVVAALVAAAGYLSYTRVYLPSTRPVLNGAPLVPAERIEKLAADPLSSRPPAEQQQFSTDLHDAVARVEPGYRIESEELYVRPGGYDWQAIRQRANAYLGEFGFAPTADGRAEQQGRQFDYLVWRPDWLHAVVDDRIVMAVMLREPRPPAGPSVFGYFVLRPG